MFSHFLEIRNRLSSIFSWSWYCFHSGSTGRVRADDPNPKKPALAAPKSANTKMRHAIIEAIVPKNEWKESRISCLGPCESANRRRFSAKRGAYAAPRRMVRLCPKTTFVGGSSLFKWVYVIAKSAVMFLYAPLKLFELNTEEQSSPNALWVHRRDKKESCRQRDAFTW